MGDNNHVGNEVAQKSCKMAANVRGIARRSGLILDVIKAARKTKVIQGMY